MLNMGEDAFEGQDQNAIQRQLVGYFIDGLREDHQVDEAVPMEVDHYRSPHCRL